MATPCSKAEITLDVKLTVKLVADVGVTQEALDAYLAEHLDEIRKDLVGDVRLRSDQWSSYITPHDEVYVDDLLDAELI